MQSIDTYAIEVSMKSIDTSCIEEYMKSIDTSMQSTVLLAGPLTPVSLVPLQQEGWGAEKRGFRGLPKGCWAVSTRIEESRWGEGLQLQTGKWSGTDFGPTMSPVWY